MASRLLSTTVNNRAGIAKQLVRPLATAAQQATRTTVLSNGLTVATEESTGAPTVGVYIGAGSRADNVQNSGAANLVQRIATQNAKLIGGELASSTTHDHTLYTAKTIDVAKSVDTLAGLVQDLKFDTLEAQRAAILNEQPNEESVTFEHLHATAFQGTSLGLPVSGLNVENLTEQDLSNFVKSNYTADRMVLVGAGNVDHDALVKLAEKSFGGLTGAGASAPAKPSFTGSEIRIRDDLAPAAHVAIAVEGAPLYSQDYLNMLVMQAIVGSWDSTLGGAANLFSRLSTVVNNNKLADSFASFTKGYKDTGLWGMYFVTRNKEQIDDFVHFMQKEWIRLSTTVTASEVERAKIQVQASLLLSLDSSNAIAKDIGTQILTTGKRLSREELANAVSKITVNDIRKTANAYLWDQEVAVVGNGPIESLTDYNRVRGFMSYNRF
ncbi:mitochondrial processing peptidase beta [Lichtheimia corymbifera JMRC:FSU:9682]|uniref:mitochondrial processing peptidase n=1 Tax=Lichtheimia corymbifera JMRC:FSU:9682 TaxID=1263082 RepID=A0A068SGM2_9FUNG|nr:mitochondrial processing peptidase beta [Lichtheimia corymbifera JMRC:FSU:9682]